jgi:hypothetical protein
MTRNGLTIICSLNFCGDDSTAFLPSGFCAEHPLKQIAKIRHIKKVAFVIILLNRFSECVLLLIDFAATAWSLRLPSLLPKSGKIVHFPREKFSVTKMRDN